MGDDPSPLFIGDISAELGSGLGSSVHEKHVHTVISPVRSHDKGPEASDMGGEDEGTGTVQPGSDKVPVTSYQHV